MLPCQGRHSGNRCQGLGFRHQVGLAIHTYWYQFALRLLRTLRFAFAMASRCPARRRLVASREPPVCFRVALGNEPM